MNELYRHLIVQTLFKQETMVVYHELIAITYNNLDNSIVNLQLSSPRISLTLSFTRTTLSRQRNSRSLTSQFTPSGFLTDTDC